MKFETNCPRGIKKLTIEKLKGAGELNSSSPFFFSVGGENLKQAESISLPLGPFRSPFFHHTKGVYMIILTLPNVAKKRKEKKLELDVEEKLVAGVIIW